MVTKTSRYDEATTIQLSIMAAIANLLALFFTAALLLLKETVAFTTTALAAAGGGVGARVRKRGVSNDHCSGSVTLTKLVVFTSVAFSSSASSGSTRFQLG